jgi:DNA-directed RNA polymerase specialized sigma24 family protein
VQDVLARAGAAAPYDLREPVAWLTRVVTNAALDRLRSARVRREAHVGTWLPEPEIGPPWPPDPGRGDPRLGDPGERVTLVANPDKLGWISPGPGGPRGRAGSPPPRR